MVYFRYEKERPLGVAVWDGSSLVAEAGAGCVECVATSEGLVLFFGPPVWSAPDFRLANTEWRQVESLEGTLFDSVFDWGKCGMLILRTGGARLPDLRLAYQRLLEGATPIPSEAGHVPPPPIDVIGMARRANPRKGGTTYKIHLHALAALADLANTCKSSNQDYHVHRAYHVACVFAKNATDYNMSKMEMATALNLLTASGEDRVYARAFWAGNTEIWESIRLNYEPIFADWDANIGQHANEEE
jgi:hypothetical protein